MSLVKTYIKPYERPIEMTDGRLDELKTKELINNAFAQVAKPGKYTFTPFDRYEAKKERPKNISDVLLMSEIPKYDIEIVKDLAYLPILIEDRRSEYKYIYTSVPDRVEYGEVDIGVDGEIFGIDQRGVYISDGQSAFYYDTATNSLRVIGSKDGDGNWTINGIETGSSGSAPYISNGVIEGKDGNFYFIANGCESKTNVGNYVGLSVYGDPYPIVLILVADNEVKVLNSDTCELIMTTSFNSVVKRLAWMKSSLWVETNDGYFLAKGGKVRKTKFAYNYTNKYDFIGYFRQFGYQNLEIGDFLFVRGAPTGYWDNNDFYTPHTINFLANSDDFIEVVYYNIDRSKHTVKLLYYDDEPDDDVLTRKYKELTYIQNPKRFVKSDKVGMIIDGVFKYYKYTRRVK